jgi:sigma-B regulation protein RsbU (phosphoserine phosphatase)
MLAWIVSWSLVGCAVALGIVFATDIDLAPALRLSVLFAEVVGLTAFASARVIFPLFTRLPYLARVALEVLTLLSGTVFGSVAVLALQPFFTVAQFRNIALIVLVNATIGVVVGIALDTYDTMKRQIEAQYRALQEKEALEREMRIARDVQQRLLPSVTPRVEGLQLAGICEPAIGVGGDYFDFVSLPDERTGLVIADVSGKGIPAALLMANLQASVRSLAPIVPDPALLTAQLNKNLYQASDAARYATLFFGFYDPRERTLRYSNAGHHPPVLLRGREVSRLDERGLPIGLFATADYSEGRTRLRPGDLLALFTDGVSETPDANGEEFGEERLIALLLRHRELDLREIVAAVLGELGSWSTGAEPHDDVTLVLARAQ